MKEDSLEVSVHTHPGITKRLKKGILNVWGIILDLENKKISQDI